MKDYAETTVRVRYAETDQMGVVYHGNYFTWFEIGRVELCRQLGFEYKKMESEDDSLIVVAEAQCRYKKPAKFDDLLAIRTRVTQSQPAHAAVRLRGYPSGIGRSAGYRRDHACDLRQPRPTEIASGEVSQVFSCHAEPRSRSHGEVAGSLTRLSCSRGSG